MNDEPCIVTINTTDYYVACNMIDNLVVMDNALINTSSSSITLYANYPDYNDNTSGYPRITISANQKAIYRSQYNATQTQLSVNNFKVVNRHYSNDVFLMIVLIGISVINLFKRG